MIGLFALKKKEECDSFSVLALFLLSFFERRNRYFNFPVLWFEFFFLFFSNMRRNILSYLYHFLLFLLSRRRIIIRSILFSSLWFVSWFVSFLFYFLFAREENYLFALF